MAKRVVMRVELTEEAKSTLSRLSRRRGMTQVAVASRLMEWFAQQTDSVQAAILGQYPAEIEPDVARIILKRMSENPQTSDEAAELD